MLSRKPNPPNLPRSLSETLMLLEVCSFNFIKVLIEQAYKPISTQLVLMCLALIFDENDELLEIK